MPVCISFEWNICSFLIFISNNFRIQKSNKFIERENAAKTQFKVKLLYEISHRCSVHSTESISQVNERLNLSYTSSSSINKMNKLGKVEEGRESGGDVVEVFPQKHLNRPFLTPFNQVANPTHSQYSHLSLYLCVCECVAAADN